METFWPLALFIISIIALIRSGSVVVLRLSRIAYFFQLSEFAVSFALIAFATSLPDVFVGVTAALHGKPELSLSNIIGANIITITLALGIAVLFAGGIAVRRSIVRRDALYAGAGALLPILLMLDKTLSRTDGVLLLLFFAWYFISLIFQEEHFSKIFSNNGHSLFQVDKFFKDLAVLIVAIIALLISAEGVTRSAVILAENFGIALPVIGILLVAASITLPEVVFGTKAVMMGHKNMVLGNIIGSLVVNSGLAIGLTAVISPLHITSFEPFLTGMVFSVAVIFAFLLFTYTKRKITSAEAIALIAIYALFVAAILGQNGNL